MGRENLQLWLTADFDASLGNAGPQVQEKGESEKIRLEPDGHARMGICLFLAPLFLFLIRVGETNFVLYVFP